MGEENELAIETAARASHEVNRAWCVAHGDTSQVDWTMAPEWQKTSARNGVRGVIAGNTPRESHESWLQEKREAGWKYGPVKDPEKKEHPCFVPYEDLPPEQQAKDLLFVTTVRSILNAMTFTERRESPEGPVERTRAEVLERLMSIEDRASTRTEITLKFEAKLADSDEGLQQGVLVSLNLLNAMVDAALSLNPAILDPLNISEISAKHMSYRVTDTGRALKRRLKEVLAENTKPLTAGADGTVKVGRGTTRRVSKGKTALARKARAESVRKSPPPGLTKAQKKAAIASATKAMSKKAPTSKKASKKAPASKKASKKARG